MPPVWICLLRSLKEPLGRLVHDGDLRQPDQEPRLLRPTPASDRMNVCRRCHRPLGTFRVSADRLSCGWTRIATSPTAEHLGEGERLRQFDYAASDVSTGLTAADAKAWTSCSTP